MRKEKGLVSNKVEAIPRLSPNTALVLSPIQERLWFLNQNSPDSSAYNIAVAISVEGEIDLSIIVEGVNNVIHRQESLRTRFVNRDGQPNLIIEPELTIAIPTIDCRGDSEQTIQSLISDEVKKPFDLENGPIIRLSRLEKSDNQFILLLCIHHIVAEDTAFTIFLAELSAFITANLSGQTPTLANLDIQYTDYAHWYRQAIEKPSVAETQLSFWCDHLKGELPVLQLPTDFPRPPIQHHEGTCLSLELGDGLSTQVRDFCKAQGITSFMFCFAAYALLLHRYTAQNDIIIGTPISGRNRPELQPLIGCFVNTMALRLQFADNVRVDGLLKNVRDTLLKAYVNQDLPFEKIVEAIQPQRDPSYNPIFQTLFSFQDNRNESWKTALKIPGASTHAEVIHTDTAKVDLSLLVEDHAKGMKIQFEYNSALFSIETINRLLGYLKSIVEKILSDANGKVNTLTFMSAEEKRKVLVDWNNTEVAVPKNLTVADLVRKQSQQCAKNLALVSDSGSINYQQLHQKAKTLAQSLQKMGLGRDSVIGVYLPRDHQLIVSCLAVIYSGAAYLPIDLKVPPKRLQFMLHDSAASLLITQSELTEHLDDMIISTLCVDQHGQEGFKPSDDPVIDDLVIDDLAIDIQGHDPAYLIYTSGSTGKPKAVVINHSALLNLVQWHQRVYQVTSQDRASHLAGLGFDAAVWELWPYLCAGATVVLCDDETRLSAKQLLHWYVKHDITLSFLPTPLAEAFLQEVSKNNSLAEKLPLRFLLTGGDKLRSRPVPGLPFRLMNHYGPTENTVVTTATEILPAAKETRGQHLAPMPPIGKPIDNTQVYLLDGKLQPVPIGARGTLFISGAGISLGYLNQPDLNAKRFISNPFAKEGHRILYNTGDHARYLANGELEFLERDDFQVKIRGLRIELGEVETALLSHPLVQQGIVLALPIENNNDTKQDHKQDDKQIVAFYQQPSRQECEQKLDENELRQHMAKFLPDYMLPAYFIGVDSFQLTPNGKIDRHSLSLPSQTTEQSRDQVSAPATDTEKEITDLWATQLGLAPDQLGSGDNFFHRGGHSLLATKIIAKINQQFSLDLPVSSLFQQPTIASLSKLIDKSQGKADLHLLPLIRSEAEGDIPATLAQQRLWYLDQLDPGNPVYNIPLTIEFEGSMDSELLQQALRQVVAKHDALRTTFAVSGVDTVQIIHPSVDCDLKLHEVAESDQKNVNDLLEQQALTSFDLQKGPLLNAQLLRLTPTKHLLAITVHHIVFDGASSQIFLDELVGTYREMINDKAYTLPLSSIRFSDYALWQKQWIAQGGLDAQLAVWQQRLAGSLPVLEMPSQFSRPTVQSAVGHQVDLMLEKDLVKDLGQHCANQGVTQFVYLLSVYFALLHRYTQQHDLIVGTTIGNRRRQETQDLVGFFVNTLAIRTELNEKTTFDQLLQQVNQVCIEAFANQDLPFAKVVEVLNPPRDPSRTPVFQTLFSVYDKPTIKPVTEDLSASLANNNSQVARTDLSMSVQRSPDGLVLQLEYCAELFSQNFATELLRNYQTLLQASIAQSGQPVCMASLLNAQALDRQLRQWNTTHVDRAPAQTQLAMFKQRVASDPEKIAVKAGGKSFTYAEINQQILIVANQLQQQGLVPGDMVAICVSRSELLLVAMMSVFQCGACYLPLDPEYPQQRIKFILDDAKAQFVLLEKDLVELFSNTAANLIDIRATLTEAAKPSELPVPTDENALAYVIYTSGSTGNPKGVMVSQDNLSNFIIAMAARPGMSQQDCLLAVTTLSFDIAVLELLAPLALGATTVIADRDTVLNPPALAKAISDNAITLMQATPSTWQALLAAEWSGKLDMKLLVGGEALPIDLAKRLVTCVAEVWNMYGPTETTVWSSCYQFTDKDDIALIGKPIANTQLYVLDPQCQLVPIGVPGELYIGGKGVSQGYRGRDDLTRERFMTNPITEDKADRLYRTGDSVRFDENGNLEYLNRLDNQVKIRGFRIELGEIESVINDMPEIKQAVVVVREDVPGDSRLVAYHVADTEISVAELRKACRARLPNYMIPQHYMAITELPLTPNGKIDRRALPAPNNVGREKDRYVAPRSQTESILAEIWQQALQVDKVGIQDNFFELGGHSLLSFQVIATAKQKLGVQLPLRAMVMDTLAQIAAQYDATMKNNDELMPSTSEPFGRRLLGLIKSSVFGGAPKG